MVALVIPGFLASDKHTNFFRKKLKELNVSALPWEGGTNIGYGYGFIKDSMDKAIDRITKLNLEFGETIDLIGWSLGGTLCCDIANDYPFLVKTVTTICSPSKRIKLSRPNLCIIAKVDRVVPRFYSYNYNATKIIEVDSSHTQIINDEKVAKIISEFIKNH